MSVNCKKIISANFCFFPHKDYMLLHVFYQNNFFDQKSKMAAKKGQ